MLPFAAIITGPCHN